MTDTADLVNALRALEGRVTELAELSRGNIVNHVLFSGTIQIPASGTFSMDFAVPMASVAVQASITGGSITVAAAPLSTTAPSSGIGVASIDTNALLCIPMTGRILSFYGSSGDLIYVAVSTRPWPVAGA